MKNIKTLLSTLLLISICYCAHGQKLDHVLGEVIIEVKDNNAAKSLLADLRSDSRISSAVIAKNIMAEPMNLWVLKVDQNRVNEHIFLDVVKMNKHTLLAQKNHLTTLRNTPNDPLFNEQWQYINLGSNGGEIGADIDIDIAWDYATGGNTIAGDEIVVCVIDDGIRDHPDIVDNLWTNSAEIPDNGIDDDGNGYVDDVRGWNAEDNNDNVFQGGSHGTPVAGIVGAKGNNEEGVAGVNWDVGLMIVKGGSPEALALASYAYPYTMRKLYNETNGEKGAFVVSTNSSWGIDNGDPADAPIWCDFYNKLGEVGILNFGATANVNTNVDIDGDLPTACDSDYLISVTNMTRQDEKITSAGYGLRTIDLGAFGEDTYTLRGNGYGEFGGTSGATPHCAGTAALLYAADCDAFMTVVKENPALAALAVKDYILYGVDPNQSLLGITTTGGRLNANYAMQNLLSTCGDCTQAFGVSINDIEIDNATITWVDNGKIGNVNIRYRIQNETDWTLIEGLTSGQKLTDLEICTSYEYQVATSCDPVDDGKYSYTREFKTDGCCVVPQGFAADLSGNTITVDWGNVTAASNFIFEYRRASDDEWISADIGTDNTFTFEAMEGCDFYELRIKSECAVTSNESEYSQIIGLSTNCGACSAEFCDFGSKDTSDEWIGRVAITDIFENISGVNTDGYGNFVGQFDIDLKQDEEYTIELSPEYSSTQYDEFFSAYLDFNQDGVLTDDEVIYESEIGTNTPVMGTFTVPADAKLGITRLRVIMRYNESNDGACDELSFEYGEVEDYCVNIVLSTNVNDIANQDVTIYPTLADQFINIDIKSQVNDIASVEIIALGSGQTVIRENSTSSSRNVNVSELSAGAYLVVVKLGIQVYSEKVIVGVK